MLYYLTRDAQIESVLIQQQRFIFDKYRLPDGKGLAWVLEDGDEQSASNVSWSLSLIRSMAIYCWLLRYSQNRIKAAG